MFGHAGAVGAAITCLKRTTGLCKSGWRCWVSLYYIRGGKVLRIRPDHGLRQSFNHCRRSSPRWSSHVVRRAFIGVVEWFHAHPTSMRRSWPAVRLTTSVRVALRCLPCWLFVNILCTSSTANWPMRVCFTAHPRLSLSASCAEIQARAYRLRAISRPPGDPADMLPPSHHGLSTQSKECKSAVKGKADSDTRCDVAYGRMVSNETPCGE